jgi:hypothetical protein
MVCFVQPKLSLYQPTYGRLVICSSDNSAAVVCVYTVLTNNTGFVGFIHSF